jgi:hypothetical protein
MTICLFTIFSSSRHSIVVSISDYLFFTILSIVSNTNHNRIPERRENCKKQIVSNTNNNRMPERRENCKKQIVSNTNNNIVVSITDYFFLTILSSFRHSIVFSITDYLFSYSFLFFPAFYCC